VHLGELAERLMAMSRDPAVRGLAERLRDWQSDDTTVMQLRDSVERHIGHAWIESTSEHEQVHDLWSGFRREAIDPIAGMTMNERLYWFDLFARFDACETDEERACLYAKLLASP
jgi:hypothetical protein